MSSLKRASKALLKKALQTAFSAQSSTSSGIPLSHFGLEADGGGNVTLCGVRLSELAKESGSPLHVVNLERLRENARRFLAAPTDLTAGCEVFYSYKTNPIPGVLAELHRNGIGAEVISHYELWLALKLGVPPSRIIYNGPAKSEASIRQAIELGIELLNINHREEIGVVARIASELRRKARVGLRVSLGGWAGQFGTPAAGGQALRAYEEALSSEWLDVVGLHVHRGGMMQAEAEALQFIDGVLSFTDTLREQLGLGLSILDLGGSLGSPSVRGLGGRELRLNRAFFRQIPAPDPARALSIEAYTSLLLTRVREHYARRSEAPPRLFLEPGRAMTSDAQLLLTRVHGLKHDGERHFAIMDAGVNVAESCRSEYHQIIATQHKGRRTQTYTIVGPICTPGDTLYWAARLPALEVGDTLAVMDAGAYFVPFSTSFSFPRPGVVLLDGGRITPLRRAETFDDLIRLDAVEAL